MIWILNKQIHWELKRSKKLNQVTQNIILSTILKTLKSSNIITWAMYNILVDMCFFVRLGAFDFSQNCVHVDSKIYVYTWQYLTVKYMCTSKRVLILQMLKLANVYNKFIKCTCESLHKFIGVHVNYCTYV